jgi:benzoyl-CoA 2,3-dioxygenase component A
MERAAIEIVKQHLIDPEICIRCNTCEATCPVGAITHDSRNYVVRADVCNGCMACVPPCPTGAIDNWREVAKERAYSIEEQLGWDILPTAAEGAVVAPPSAPTAPPPRRGRRRNRRPTCTPSPTRPSPRWSETFA